MGFTDKTLTCTDCAATFTFSASEQELFASKGYTNEPKRCPTCREARKSEKTGNRPRPQMFPVKCSQCGKDTEVPFQPREGRPVYCSTCYNSTRQQSR
jgi:CxxC-x17-CxxC domain-containing protein